MNYYAMERIKPCLKMKNSYLPYNEHLINVDIIILKIIKKLYCLYFCYGIIKCFFYGLNVFYSQGQIIAKTSSKAS